MSSALTVAASSDLFHSFLSVPRDAFSVAKERMLSIVLERVHVRHTLRISGTIDDASPSQLAKVTFELYSHGMQAIARTRYCYNDILRAQCKIPEHVVCDLHFLDTIVRSRCTTCVTHSR